VIAMSDGRILIADDEPSVRDAVGYALQQEGFDVTLAEDGDDADRKLGNDAPGFDLLILDIMMPGRSGLDICRDVRARSPVPIILLTAKDAEVDKVVGSRLAPTITSRSPSPCASSWAGCGRSCAAASWTAACRGGRARPSRPGP